MPPNSKDELEREKKQPLLPKDPAYISLASRYPLHLIFILVSSLLVGAISLVFSLWTSSIRDEIARRSREKATRISRLISADITKINEKILRSLEKSGSIEDQKPASQEREFQNIAKNLEGTIDAHLYRLDSHKIIRQVSRPSDKKFIGRTFDEGTRIRFTDLQEGLSISEILPGQDTKNPIFEWRKKRKSGSYVLQAALNDFGNWCKQIFIADRQDVYLSISSREGKSSKIECGSTRDLHEIWKVFQKSHDKENLSSLIYVNNQDYATAYQQLDKIPINIAVFTRVPSTSEIFLYKNSIVYALLGVPIFLYLLVFYIFRQRVAEHNSKIHLLCSNLLNPSGKSTYQAKFSKEFEPAFSALLGIHDTLETIHTKNSIKTKLATELSNHYFLNDLFSKATELIGNQSKVDACYFIPNRSSQPKSPLKGWSWIRHNLKELQTPEEAIAPVERSAQSTFRIPAQKGDVILGDFYLIAPKLSDKIILDVAPSIIGLIENVLTRNETLLGEAIKNLENETATILKFMHESSWQIDKSSYEVASLYMPPTKHAGEFSYILSSPRSDDFFFIIGGPSITKKGSSGPYLEQMSVPPISWTIKGIMDVFRKIFDTPGGSLQLSPRDVVDAIHRAVRDVAPNSADSWSYFACHYNQSKSQLTYFSAGRRDPLFLLKNGEICAHGPESLIQPYQGVPSLNFGSVERHQDITLEIKPGDMMLMLPGSASIGIDDRHQLFHEILARRLAALDTKLSATKIRDYLRDLQAYYYQNQSIDKDLCIFLFQCFTKSPHLDHADLPSDLAS